MMENLKFFPPQIRAEHVKLSWAPPEDDGGTPVLRYLIRLMDLDCSEWITACEVTAPATSTTVRNLKPGHLYRFEVYAINKEGESEPTQSEPVKAEAPYSEFILKKIFEKNLIKYFSFTRAAQ